MEFHPGKPFTERPRVIIDTRDNYLPFCINEAPFIIGSHHGKSLSERVRVIELPTQKHNAIFVSKVRNTICSNTKNDRFRFL